MIQAPLSGAQSLLATIQTTASAVDISATVVSLDHEKVLDSVTDGLEVRITFEFRLYEKTGGLLGFLGDRLLDERRLRRSASMDFFADQYVVTDDQGHKTPFIREADFVRFLSRLPSCTLEYQGGHTETETLYVMARARIDYVTLDPPLNIVNLFTTTAVTTDWQRTRVWGSQ
jgi:hypothetical protein